MVVPTVLNAASTESSQDSTSTGSLVLGVLNLVTPTFAQAQTYQIPEGALSAISPKDAITNLADQGMIDMKSGKAAFKFAFSTLPKQETRVVMKKLPGVNTALTAILRSFNRQLDVLEQAPQEEYYVPTSKAVDIKNALLDAVSANFSKLTLTENFKVFLGSLSTVSTELRGEYKTFFERLVNRASDRASQKTNQLSVTPIQTSPARAILRLSKLPLFRSFKRNFTTKLQELDITPQLMEANKSLRRDRKTRRKAIAERFGRYTELSQPLAALETEWNEAASKAMAEQKLPPKFDTLSGWEPVAEYLSHCRRMQNRYDLMQNRFFYSYFVNESIVETLKPTNRELSVALKPHTNPDWTETVREYLQGAFRTRIRDHVKAQTESSPALQEIVMPKVAGNIPATNVYDRIIKKFNQFKETPKKAELRSTFEHILTKPFEGLIWLTQNKKDYLTSNEWDVKNLDTIVLKTNSSNATGEVVERIGEEGAEAVFMKDSLTKAVDESGLTFLKKKGVKVTDPKILAENWKRMGEIITKHKELNPSEVAQILDQTFTPVSA